MPKKIIKFKTDADLYFDMAEEKLDEGDYESAIYYFYRSYQEKDSVDALLALGETYCEIGEPEEGLKYLLIALDRQPNNEDICQCVTTCFSCMGEEETAFFYFQPGMTVKKFRSLMDEEWQPEEPKIRLVENNDEMMISIAAKLLLSGDTVYAKEMLLTIKPDSKYYASARNILALSALDSDAATEALQYINDALAQKDTADLRYTRIIALYLLQKHDALEADIKFVETCKIDLDGHRAAAMAYIRIERAELAARHLKFLLDAGLSGRDYMVSYALSLYNSGDLDQAKVEIISATRLYPEDVAVEEIAKLMSSGKKLSMYPLLPEDITQEWFEKLSHGLNLINESKKYHLHDSDEFIKLIKWLFQGKYAVRQGKAGLILAKRPEWHKFLKTLLLDNYMDLPAKKLVLYGLLLRGGHKRIGIVLYGMYARLKVKYPECNQIFRSAYCLAFASFAFADSCFEDRLLNGTENLLKKYDAHSFDQAKIQAEDALAAVLFFASNRNKNIKAVHCAHIFGCDEGVMREYMDLFGVEEC